MKLKGKVALVTGGSREVGRAICTSLAEAGTIVIIGFLKGKKKAEEISAIIKKGGGKGIIWRIDVTQRKEVEKMLEMVRDRFGRIDILVNNARGAICRKEFLETAWDEYQKQIDVLLKGIFNCSQAVISQMREQRYGRIINILSSLTDAPVRGYSTYITALSAIRGFTKSIALECAEYGITVNNIFPGFTLTSQTPHAPLAVQKKIAERTPLKRLALPLDIAKAVLFFASDLSEFITGTNLRVDGGWEELNRF